MGDTFVYDLRAASVTRVSVTGDGAQAGGEFVFYRASAADLVPGDSNGVDDVFRTSLKG